MPADYDWYTEDEAPHMPSEEPRPADRRGRRWPRLVIALFLVVAVGVVVSRQLRQRVTDAESRAEAELTASQAIVDRAGEEADADVLTPFLSGRDRAWTAAYGDLARQGLLSTLAPLGINSRPAGVKVVDIRLSDDFFSAEVDMLRNFEVSGPLGVTATVAYRQTNVYRRSSDRWLLAPPDPEFWGADSSVREGRVRVGYPGRDAKLARKLANLVDDSLAEFCSRLETNTCRPDLRLAITLSSDPASLLAAADPRTILESGRQVTLPSPSYFGVPGDSASEDVLLRGYAAQALSAVIADLSGWSCCSHGLYFRALVDAELRSLGLRVWPLKPIQYEALLAAWEELTAHRGSWYNEWLSPDDADGEWPAAYAIVEFVLDYGTHQPLDLMNQLEVPSFGAWLLEALGPNPDAPEVHGAWLRFVYERSLSIQAAERRPPFEQDIYLLCWSEDYSPISTLYRYKVEDDTWQVDATWNGFTYMQSLPRNAGTVLQIFGPEEAETVVWRQGRAEEYSLNPLQDGERFTLEFIGLSDPQGRYLVALDEDSLYRGDNMPELYLVPVEGCTGQQSCQIHRLPGYPIWSPDGKHLIVLPIGGPLFRQSPAPLSLADEAGRILRSIGEGSQPGWLNDEAYAYVRSDGTIVTASIDDAKPEALLERTDLVATLMAALPDELQPLSGDLREIALGPSNGTLATISAVAGSDSGERRFFYTYDYAQDRLRLILVLGNVQAGLQGFSPDGRWVEVRSLEATGPDGSQPWSYYFYNVESGQLRVIADGARVPDSDIAFSADSNWLLRSFEGFVDLIALTLDVGGGYPYHLMIAHEFADCRSAAWASPGK